jgi:hypothetical protein
MGRKVFKARNENHNNKIIASIDAIRATNDSEVKESEFTKIFKLVSRIIFSFLSDKPDEYNSMVHATLWQCILDYSPKNGARFTTYLWAALSKESQKVKRYEKRLAPQLEEGKREEDPQSKGYIDGLSTIIAMISMGSVFDGIYSGSLNRELTESEKLDEPVYVGFDDCVCNAMLVETVLELKAKHDKAWDIFIYMHENDCDQTEAGRRFGYSQQYVSKLLVAFAKEVGYENRAPKKSSKNYWSALAKRLNAATSSEHYDSNGRLLDSEELHAYRMATSKSYRESKQLAIEL